MQGFYEPSSQITLLTPLFKDAGNWLSTLLILPRHEVSPGGSGEPHRKQLWAALYRLLENEPTQGCAGRYQNRQSLLTGMLRLTGRWQGQDRLAADPTCTRYASR